MILASPTEPPKSDMRADWLGAWQQYGVQMGMPSDQMASTIARLAAMPAMSEEDHVSLLRKAGFNEVTCFFSALVIRGWIARQSPAQ